MHLGCFMWYSLSPQDQLQSSTGWNAAVKIAEKVGHCLQQPGVAHRRRFVMRFGWGKKIAPVLDVLKIWINFRCQLGKLGKLANYEILSGKKTSVLN